MVDCSHGNSQKLHTNQKVVAGDLAAQVSGGSAQIMGVMIESFIEEGRQDVGPDPKTLKYPLFSLLSPLLLAFNIVEWWLIALEVWTEYHGCLYFFLGHHSRFRGACGSCG